MSEVAIPRQKRLPKRIDGSKIHWNDPKVDDFNDSYASYGKSRVKVRILFVDDEPGIRAMGAEYLRMVGHDVTTAENLAQARDLLYGGTRKFHLVISDHRLPDGKGIEFVLEARQKLPEVQTTIVSGCLTDEDKMLLDTAGIKYFVKPLLFANVIKHFQVPPKITLPPAPVEPDPPIQPERKKGFTASIFAKLTRHKGDESHSP